MMIKITERCSMGCSHCMNSAKADGMDMPLDIFRDAIQFLKENSIGQFLVLTGGEPTEHKQFWEMMQLLKEMGKGYFLNVTITTNGENILKEKSRYVEFQKSCEFPVCFQISADKRFYPRRINVKDSLFKNLAFVLCDNCVTQIYPQGRAMENHLPWIAKASKCFNVRAVSKQIATDDTLQKLEGILAAHGKHCTPHIKINGDIGLGESDLCPSCSSIYKDGKQIMDDIRTFTCHGCDFINQQLPAAYRKFVL